MIREHRRFSRYDRNGDRNELMATRTTGFRKFDRDGNLQLTPEELRAIAPKAKRPAYRC